MSARTATILGLALGPLLVVVLDLLLTREGGSFFATWRDIVRSTAFPSFVIGVLMGHWYYPGRPRTVVRHNANYWWLIGIVGGVVGLSLLLLLWEDASHFASTVFVLAGIPVGIAFWSMEPDEPSAQG